VAYLNWIVAMPFITNTCRRFDSGAMWRCGGFASGVRCRGVAILKSFRPAHRCPAAFGLKAGRLVNDDFGAENGEKAGVKQQPGAATGRARRRNRRSIGRLGSSGWMFVCAGQQSAIRTRYCGNMI